MQLEWSSGTALFTPINTGWMMKWRWREEVEQSASPNILRECWTFLIRIFLHQMRKQCLEFGLPNPGEICKHLAGATIQTVTPVGLCYLTFVCNNHCHWRESFKEVHLRKAHHYWSSLKEEKPLQFLIPLTLLPKNHNLFCERKEGLKRGRREKGKPCPPAYNGKVYYTGRWVCEDRRGRGGGGSFIHSLNTSQAICERYENMRNT